MAISKSVLMKSGVTATHWKITHISVDTQKLESCFVLSPFLDAQHAEDRARPVGPSKTYCFGVTEEQILSGSLNDVYLAILAKAASSVQNLIGLGTHIYDPDLVGGVIV